MKIEIKFQKNIENFINKIETQLFNFMTYGIIKAITHKNQSLNLVIF